jgi:SOS response regulatory protein OraA/RecX
MALSSLSTVDDARAQLRDNLSWRGRASRAEAFCEAFLFLEDAEPDGSAEGAAWSARAEKLQDEYDAARAYADSQSSTSATGPRATRVRPAARFRG